MSYRLQILRHAKSDWSQTLDDFDRPLNSRGRESIPVMGEWMRKRNDPPGVIYSSTALRAKQTILGVIDYLNYPQNRIQWQPELYLASLENLLAMLAEWLQPNQTIMLVGHNPGLEHLVHHLSSNHEFGGREFPTAAFACLELNLPELSSTIKDRKNEIRKLTEHCGKLVVYHSPKNI